MARPLPSSDRKPIRGELPTVIIIGGMKCATSSLHYYMGLHPEIWMSRRKELNFFSEDSNWARGEEWYRSWFRTDRQVRGEASPGYAAYPKFLHVPARMRSVVPDAKLIYLVRDPVDRLISHYIHNVAESKERKPFAEAVGGAGSEYIARSRYAMQLERYLEHWSLDRILIVRRESLLEQRDATLDRVFRFVGVQPGLRDVRLGWHRHRSAHKRRKTRLGERIAATGLMRLVRRLPQRVRWPVEDAAYLPFSRRVPRPEPDPELLAELRGVLRPDIERLMELTGERFDDWFP